MRGEASLPGESQGELAARVLEHHPMLRERIAKRIAPRYRSALSEDDVLQLTYVEALLRAGQFGPETPDSLAKWLWRIAENNLIDALRGLDRAKREPRHRQMAANGDSYSTLLDRFSGSFTSPSGPLHREDHKRVIENALGKLPADYATAIRLTELELLPTEEVASMMKRSVGAVYMLKSRAMDRLRELLREDASWLP